VHRIATEATLVVSGKVAMNGRHLRPGDIAVVRPGEACHFEALTNAVTVVVKAPSAPFDKEVLK
jgi:hypothetical protein